MSRQHHIDKLDQKRVTIARDLERVAALVRDAREGIVAQAKRAGDRVRSDAARSLRELAGDARDVALRARTDSTATAKQKMRDAGRRAAGTVDPRRVVREQPLVGLAASLGVGFALALLAPRLTPGAGLAD